MAQERELNLKKVSNHNRHSASREIELIEQFFVTLSATFQQVKVNNPHAAPDIVKSINDLLKDKNWENAYEIERLLIEIYDDETLDVELDRRLVEAKVNLAENVSAHYVKSVEEIPKVDDQTTPAKKVTIADEKRAILNRMVNDLQWNYSLKETRRKYSREISLKNGVAFILSIIIFIAMIIIAKLFDLVGNLNYLAIALGAGIVGASFSMVVNSRSRLAASGFDELKALRRPIYVFTRVLIGLGAALILYFVLGAEMLTGSVFPNFTPSDLVTFKTNDVTSEYLIFNIPDSTLKKDEIKKAENTFIKTAPKLLTSDSPGAKDTLAAETKKFLKGITINGSVNLDTHTTELANKLWSLADPTPFLDFKNLALLIIWSIIAGFSEKFVPNLLAKAEEQATVK